MPNLAEYMTLIPKLIPYSERLVKAIQTLQRIEADPEVQDAIALVSQIAHLFEQQGEQPQG